MQSVNTIENFLFYTHYNKEKTALEPDLHYDWVISMLVAKGLSMIMELHTTERDHSLEEAVKLANIYAMELTMLINKLKTAIDVKVTAELESILKYVTNTIEILKNSIQYAQ